MKDRPWIWIIVFFVLMVAALGTMVVIAVKNEPESVPLENNGFH
jgi:FtsH-binding integral membrane protein